MVASLIVVGLLVLGTAIALQLALPRIAGDAVPSQPLLYRLVAA